MKRTFNNTYLCSGETLQRNAPITGDWKSNIWASANFYTFWSGSGNGAYEIQQQSPFDNGFHYRIVTGYMNLSGTNIANSHDRRIDSISFVTNSLRIILSGCTTGTLKVNSAVINTVD